VSFLQRIFGTATRSDRSGETETVRRIAARLERLPQPRARHLAAFAYVLARVANSDLRISETETDAMLALVREHAGLSGEEAALAVEIAKSQTRLLGGTENYVVTREFREISTREERMRLLHCSMPWQPPTARSRAPRAPRSRRSPRNSVFLREEALALRAPWRDKLSEFQALPKKSS